MGKQQVGIGWAYDLNCRAFFLELRTQRKASEALRISNASRNSLIMVPI